MLKLYNGIFAVDNCVYLPDSKTIIISDLHLGYEQAMEKQGVLVPRTQFKTIIKRLDWILAHIAVEQVVLNGDVKHEFGTISKQEWKDVLKLIDYFEEKNIEIVAIKGNHDTILGPITRKKQIKELKELRIGSILITHGDYVPEKPAPVIIMGHEHPAITLRERGKAEKFKCFLKGNYKKSVLIIQPSFNPLTEGSDVLSGRILSPLISNLDSFEVFVVDDKKHEVLGFGKVSEITQQDSKAYTP